MIIILPFPDARLNPNRSNGNHWASTAKLRKAARIEAFWLTNNAIAKYGIELTKAVENVKLKITFVQPDRRQRDRDNLLSACKPFLDGIADGLGINDAQFEPVTICREYGNKPGCVKVEIG